VNESLGTSQEHSVVTQIADFDSHEDALQEFHDRRSQGKRVLFLRWIEDEDVYEEVSVSDDR